MRDLSKQKKIVLFLLGFLSIWNAFYLSFGGVNLRFYDIMFFVAPMWGVIDLKVNPPLKFSKRINSGCIIVALLFLYFTISGFIHMSNYTPEYSDFFIKYYIHKVIWIVFYLILYLQYGRDVLKYFFLGLFCICVFHVSLVLFEYANIIFSGKIVDFSFFNKIFIQVEAKKYDVYNQGFIRPTGLTMDPNYATGYAGIAFLYTELLKSKQSKYKVWLSVFQYLCLFMTAILFSRTGLFSLMIVIVISALFHIFISRKKYKTITPAICVLVVVLICVAISYIGLFNEVLYEQIIQRLSMKDGSSNMRQDYIFTYLNESDTLNVLFGNGTSSAGMVLTQLLGMNSGLVWHPESSYISLLIEQGVVFLILFFLFLVRLFFKLLKKNQIYAYILLYINVIGLSYNFLGDRIYMFLLVTLTLYAFDPKSALNEK